MKYVPDFDTFQQLSTQANLVPVYRQLTGDTLTPVSAYQLLEKGPYSFLFESVVGGEQISRYSFLGANPFLTIDAYQQRMVIQQQGETEERTVADPLQELESILDQYQAPELPGLPRFCGGAVGYAGYDVVRYSETCLMHLKTIVSFRTCPLRCTIIWWFSIKSTRPCWWWHMLILLPE